MKNLKIIDISTSIILILFFCILSLSAGDGKYVLTGYFVVGGWQVISMLYHSYMSWFTTKGTKRNIYNWIVFISIACVPLGSYIILLFTAPFMAIWYVIICGSEIRILNKRELIQLR